MLAGSYRCACVQDRNRTLVDETACLCIFYPKFTRVVRCPGVVNTQASLEKKSPFKRPILDTQQSQRQTTHMDKLRQDGTDLFYSQTRQSPNVTAYFYKRQQHVVRALSRGGGFGTKPIRSGLPRNRPAARTSSRRRQPGGSTVAKKEEARHRNQGARRGAAGAPKLASAVTTKPTSRVDMMYRKS